VCQTLAYCNLQQLDRPLILVRPKDDASSADSNVARDP